MRTYATESDLSDWMAPEPVPENAGGLLRAATNLVRHETRLARYATAGGQPTDPEVREAFRDATAEQVRWWAANGINPLEPALGKDSGKVVASKTIKGASVSYDTSAETTARAAREDAKRTLSPDAHVILSNAGLLGGTPVIL